MYNKTTTVFEKVLLLPKISVSARTKILLGHEKYLRMILGHVGTLFEPMMAIVMVQKAQKNQNSCEKG